MSPTCECYKPTEDVSVAINIVTDYMYFVTTVWCTLRLRKNTSLQVLQ